MTEYWWERRVVENWGGSGGGGYGGTEYVLRGVVFMYGEMGYLMRRW